MRIKWLHLSDIHFNYKSYNTSMLRDDFLCIIKKIQESEPFTHLFLSGDILNKYEKAEEATVDFINSIIEIMDISKNRVFIVPGNHDHDRNVTIQVMDDIASKSRKEKTDKIDLVDNIEDETTEKLLDSFANFNSVYEKIIGKVYYDDCHNPHQVFTEGNLSIVKLNTSWLDTDSKKTNLLCGTNKLLELLSKHKDDLSKGMNIAMGHHPIEALEEEERKRVLDLFEKYNIGIYLCGHQHKPSITKYYEKDLIQLVCPGGYNDGYSEGGYVWGIIDTDSLFYKAECYIWDKGKWCIDSRLKGTNERGIYYFDSKRYSHNSEIAAIDLKLFDGHIAKKELEDSIGQDNFDIHPYNTLNMFDWDANIKEIENFASDIKYLIEKNETVHIYPLAPIPLLIKMGFELQNNSQFMVHQYDRDEKRWVYDEERENAQLNRTCEYEDIKSPNLVVKISTSSNIDDESVYKMLSNIEYDVVEFTSTNIGLGLPLYHTTVESFAKEISSFLDTVADKYQSIHLFAAVPAGLALELGRRLLRSMYKNIYTYNFKEGQYEKAFVLNSTIVDRQIDTNVLYDYVNNSEIICLPILGKIACGDLSEAVQENDEYFPISETVLGSGEFFVLTANGDSMIDAGIEEGDLIIIRRQSNADNGQIVLAIVENETTLKRLIKNEEKKTIILHPENPKYKDMEYKELEIQGVAVKVIKSL